MSAVRYTCPRCQQTYEGDIHACAPEPSGTFEKLPEKEDPTQTPTANLDPATTPTLPGEPGAKAATTVRVDLLVGQTLMGRYKVSRKLGEGGMGAVYEAQHAVIGKRVAVKVLLDKYAQKRDVVARLMQEARLASSIGHPSIVDVSDFGETADGRSFVVMEFLDGESLAQLVQRAAPLPPERVLPILRQAADALGAAHRKGIIHRDVKPENIFLTRRGDQDFVKVVDFGISKALKKPGEDEEDSTPRLTQTGMVLGTPLYMSPEQARGESEVDERIDVYALGVILYESLTGETPYRGTNYLGIINQVLTQEPAPLRELRPDLPLSEALERVVMKMMHKDRDRRYASMAEVVADIDRLLEGDQNVGLPVELPEERRQASRRRDDVMPRRGLVLGAVTLVVVLGAITSLVASRRGTSAPETTATAMPVAPTLDAARTSGPDMVEVRLLANVDCIVYKGGEEISSTGRTIPLPRGQRVTLTCRAQGYEDAPLTFIATGEPIHFRLKPRARGYVGRGVHQTAKPVQPTSQEPARETAPNPYHP